MRHRYYDPINFLKINLILKKINLKEEAYMENQLNRNKENAIAFYKMAYDGDAMQQIPEESAHNNTMY